MSALIRIIITISLLHAIAVAAPVAAMRVVLTDRDPELRRAVETSLAPWHLEVIIVELDFDSGLPIDAKQARILADTAGAQFVVWRMGDQLVLYDRARDAIEQRDAHAGAFDPVSAAAAALSVKTMMRLPPEPGSVGIEHATVAAPPGEPGPELRVQAGVATRIAHGSTTNVGGRAAIAVLMRPVPSSGWRFGISGDLGTPTPVEHAGFKGTWSDWSVLAIASWTRGIDAWEIEPWLGAGVNRSTLSGTEMTMTRREAVFHPAAHGGVAARRRFGMWSIGGSLGIEATLGTPTYTKATPGTGATIFQVPSFGIVAGIVIGADLGR